MTCKFNFNFNHIVREVIVNYNVVVNYKVITL